MWRRMTLEFFVPQNPNPKPLQGSEGAKAGPFQQVVCGVCGM